jgi:hypothetical protein
MLTVTSILWVWKTEAAGRWFFLTIPEEQSDQIRAAAFADPRGFGSVRVEATIGAVTWRTSVFPQNSGGYILPVKAKVRSEAGISAGEEVTVTVSLLVDADRSANRS